ncbi:MAG TPA: OmpH family outer membrane protein [Acetobacteraceae bacterium]|nr:OmpH family outer membrane protein [Acetobacteraceae bacterium]
MLQHRFLVMAAFGAASVLAAAPPAGAQQAQGQGQNWFIPGQAHRPATDRRAPARAAAPAATAAPADGVNSLDEAAAAPEQIQVQLPPAPPVPDIPHGALPPASVIGVLSVPDVLRASVAYQAADKAISERRQKLSEDAQKEQVKLRDLGQELSSDRGKLSADQVRAKEKDLQDHITDSRRRFTERNRIIQEQGQYALLQIQRTLSEVVQKVAGSRGMNLVLQRAEVAVNIPEFDITNQVTEVLNKALPTVEIPAEGVSPVAMKSGSVAAAAATKKVSPPAQKHP